MQYFDYGDREIDYLKKKDKRLGAAIEKIGPIERAVFPDLFEALINSIVGQQISSKALATVWGRLVVLTGGITPESIAGQSVETLQATGITFKKAAWMKSIAEAVLAGELDLAALREMQDEEVLASLVRLDGIGIWTAEMLLLFSMQRPDVLSFGDLAIRRGIERLYGHKKVTRQQFERYRKRYSPCGSVASLYLWAIAAGRLDEVKDDDTE